jgi:DNA-binding GntR family transcriptional regulator
MYDQEDKIIISLCIIIIASVLQRIQRKIRQRKKWVRAWIQSRKHGAHHALVKELSDKDPQGFRNFLRMDTRDFF